MPGFSQPGNRDVRIHDEVGKMRGFLGVLTL
jgi:hypothetical protein